MSEGQGVDKARRGRRVWIAFGLLVVVVMLPFAVSSLVHGYRSYRLVHGGIPYRIEVLTGVSPGNRTQAAYSIGDCVTYRSVAVANGKGLHDESELVRGICAVNLKTAGRRAEWALADMIKAMANNARPASPDLACALANVGTPEAIEALELGLRSSDVDVRWSSAMSLGRIGRPGGRYVPALEKALKDETERVRQAAAEALKKIKAAQEKK